MSTRARRPRLHAACRGSPHGAARQNDNREARRQTRKRNRRGREEGSGEEVLGGARKELLELDPVAPDEQSAVNREALGDRAHPRQSSGGGAALHVQSRNALGAADNVVDLEIDQRWSRLQTVWSWQLRCLRVTFIGILWRLRGRGRPPPWPTAGHDRAF